MARTISIPKSVRNSDVAVLKSIRQSRRHLEIETETINNPIQQDLEMVDIRDGDGDGEGTGQGSGDGDGYGLGGLGTGGGLIQPTSTRTTDALFGDDTFKFKTPDLEVSELEKYMRKRYNV